MPKIRLSFFLAWGTDGWTGRQAVVYLGGVDGGGNRNLWRENNLLKAAMVASRA